MHMDLPIFLGLENLVSNFRNFSSSRSLPHIKYVCLERDAGILNSLLLGPPGELGNKVDSREQFRISFRGTVKKHF